MQCEGELGMWRAEHGETNAKKRENSPRLSGFNRLLVQDVDLLLGKLLDALPFSHRFLVNSTTNGGFILN